MVIQLPFYSYLPQSPEPIWKSILSHILTIRWPSLFSEFEKFKSIHCEEQLTSISSPLSLFRTMDSISQAFNQNMDIPSSIGGLNYSYGTRHNAKNVTRFKSYEAKSYCCRLGDIFPLTQLGLLSGKFTVHSQDENYGFSTQCGNQKGTEHLK